MIEIRTSGQSTRAPARWLVHIALSCTFVFALLWLAWGSAQPAFAEPPWPEPPVGTRTQVPILSFVGQDGTNQTLIQVQNVGSEFTRAIMLIWGEAGACGPQAIGPFKVECSGIIKPGATWMFGPQQTPVGAKSGIVYTFPNQDVTLEDGKPENLADAFCERLFSDVIFDAEAYRRFDLAFRQGTEIFGLPTAGGQPVAVDVVRVAQGTPSPDLTVSGAYSGLTGPEAGTFDPVFGGFSYYVPIVYADAGGLTSWVYIQNSGLDCTGAELWFQEQGDCLRAQICEIITLAPGETAQYNVSDCVGPSFVGNLWIRTSQPSGVVIDHIGQDVLMTDKGVPARNATFDAGDEVLFGPLIYRELQGWETSVTVQNLSGTQQGMVKVYFYDESGNIITTLVDWICPRGTQTFFLPVINGLPGQYVGAIRVESQTPYRNAGSEGPFVPIAGVAHLQKYTDPTTSHIQEAISYNLFGEPQTFDWQLGPGKAGLLGVPSVLKQGRGLSTELAIQNVNPNPGFTDFAIYLYDANGLLEVVCEKLSAYNVEYINFNAWGILNPGFVGSLVISGVYTNQQGGFGLSAVAIERVQSILQFNTPGDESSGFEAFPIFTQDFDFEGYPPQCPGQPQPCTGDIHGTVVAFDWNEDEINPEGNTLVEDAVVAQIVDDTAGVTDVTNGAGGYEIGVRPGTALVQAEGPQVTTEDGQLPDLSDNEYTTTAHFPRRQMATVECFQDEVLDFVLICKALFTVNVFDRSTEFDLPIQGATAALTVTDNQVGGVFPDDVYTTTCVTDANGQCVLEVPLIGDNSVEDSAPWSLEISAPGYDTLTVSGEEFADEFGFDPFDCFDVSTDEDALEVQVPDNIDILDADVHVTNGAVEDNGFTLNSVPTVRGKVFCDGVTIDNGVFDSGEEIVGVQVKLYQYDPDTNSAGPLVATTTTNVLGDYSFVVSLATTGDDYLVKIGNEEEEVENLGPDEVRVVDFSDICENEGD